VRAIVAAITLGISASGAIADPTPAVRGLANHVDVEYGPRLKARADQSPTSPVMVRVSQLQEGKQRVEFIGAVAGQFDLRSFLEREDGRALDGLAAIPVSVASKLPADHGTDLFSSGDSWFNWRAHYREIMWTAVGIWAAVPVVWFIVRAMRKPKAPPSAPVAARALTVEDELLAALGGAKPGEMTIEERARLELLVFRYFGERLGAAANGEDLAGVLRTLRSHPDTQELVIAIERWLHARGGAESARETAAAELERLRQSRLAAAKPTAQGVGA